MRKAAIIFLLFSLWSCKPDPIPEPIAAQLLAPVNLDNCSTADKINNNESQVSFLWSTALHTDDYELVIRNQSTGILIRKTTLLTSLNQIIPLRYCPDSISPDMLVSVNTASSIAIIDITLIFAIEAISPMIWSYCPCSLSNANFFAITKDGPLSSGFGMKSRIVAEVIWNI